jgi:hypothetical protein
MLRGATKVAIRVIRRFERAPESGEHQLGGRETAMDKMIVVVVRQ